MSASRTPRCTLCHGRARTASEIAEELLAAWRAQVSRAEPYRLDSAAPRLALEVTGLCLPCAAVQVPPLESQDRWPNRAL